MLTVVPTSAEGGEILVVSGSAGIVIVAGLLPPESQKV
jgi:hypothetical protein